ncbi:MAG: tetratricopeptide (TPR) repeat protein [Alteromonadaceae bacterium]|jgi:tetratricopeptide (TPR) repeat protein
MLLANIYNTPTICTNIQKVLFSFMIQKKHSQIIAILSLFFCFSVNQVFALSSQKKSELTSPQTLATICKISPTKCLELVDKALTKTAKNSRVYYRLLQFRFDSLFNLQRRTELLKETEPWLDNSDTPIAFRSSVYIYYAKSALFVGDKKSSKKYYILARDTVAIMNEALPSPMRLIVLANLQMQLKEFTQAYQLLSDLAKKYPNSPDVQFMMELHGNLGHASNQLGKYEEALLHWKNTKKWSELLGNKQQMAVVLYNLADLHFTLGQYDDTEKILRETILLAQQAKDIKKTNEARLYLVKTLLKLAKDCIAHQVFLSIVTNSLPVRHQASFSDIKNTIKPC